MHVDSFRLEKVNFSKVKPAFYILQVPLLSVFSLSLCLALFLSLFFILSCMCLSFFSFVFSLKVQTRSFHAIHLSFLIFLLRSGSCMSLCCSRRNQPPAPRSNPQAKLRRMYLHFSPTSVKPPIYSCAGEGASGALPAVAPHGTWSVQSGG